jgi:hypothetical protein
MGEKERAEALLQAAGVTGVAVQTAEETVTMTRAEADALRAGAPAETPGQAYVRQQQEQTQAAQLPEGIMTKEEMAAHEQSPAPKSWAEQQEQLAEGDRYVKSAEHYIRGGTI